MYREDYSLRTVDNDGYIEYHCVKLVFGALCEYLNGENRMNDNYKKLKNIHFEQTYRIVHFDCHYGYSVSIDPEMAKFKKDQSNMLGWLPPNCLRNLTPEEIEFDNDVKKYNL